MCSVSIIFFGLCYCVRGACQKDFLSFSKVFFFKIRNKVLLTFFYKITFCIIKFVLNKWLKKLPVVSLGKKIQLKKQNNDKKSIIWLLISPEFQCIKNTVSMAFNLKVQKTTVPLPEFVKSQFSG